jgi:hypothetical protein
VQALLVPSHAAIVTAFVRGSLAPRVALMDAVLALATHHVRAHLAGVEDGGTLASMLIQQALTLSAASASLSSLPPPPLEGLAALQLCSAVEDLALAADQLAGLFRETAQALQTTPDLEAGGAVIAVEATGSTAYERRVQSILHIVRRAEAWLTVLC